MADKLAAISRRDTEDRGGITEAFGDLGIWNGGTEGYGLVTVPGVAPGASASVLAGQLATSTTAAPLEAVGSDHIVAEVYIQNDPASVVNIAVGTALSQDTVLGPGQGRWFPAISTAQLYVVAASGTPNANWLTRAATGATVHNQNSTPAQLASHVGVEVVLQASLKNTHNVLLGDATHQYISLPPGGTFRIPVTNSNALYAASDAGTVDFFYVVKAKL